MSIKKIKNQYNNAFRKMNKESQDLKESQEQKISDDKSAENNISTENNAANHENTSVEITDKKNETEDLNLKLKEANDKYLRLYADFDNFRKRALREKMELIKSAGEDILVQILPVMDNFERAMQSIKTAKDTDAVKEGIELIFNNFKEFLNQKGIKEIEAVNKEFDTDLHEAITKFPAQDESMKGKVVDVIQKGYFLNEKVVRFAKVVVGE